jgi:hypothetical protein
MRENIRHAPFSSASSAFFVAAIVGFASSACLDLGDGTSRSAGPMQPAGPPTPCTASASTTPFCSSGTCPLIADDAITCPSGPVTEGFSSTGALGLASAPGERGDMVFAATSGAYEAGQEYVELGAFDPTGTATFTVDTFPPVADDTGEGGNAGLFVVADAQGAPIILSTISGGLSAAIGSATSGGTFTIEQALPAPADGDGWLIGGAVIDSGGVVDVLLQTGQTSEIARRDTTGEWTSNPLPSLGIGSAAIAVDSTGVVYVAGWVTASAAGMEQLEIIAGSNAPAIVSTLAAMYVTPVDLTVGKNADGSPLPVAAFGTTLTLAVPDGKGGFTTIQPPLMVAQPYQDGCGSSLSLGNCSCPQTCSQTGDGIGWVQLVRDAQGDVYVAWLEIDTNMTYPVTLNSTSVGSQMITCSCDPDTQNGTGTVTGLGLQLERLVMSPAPSTEHRGTIPVPSDITGSVQAVDGNGTIQLLVASASTGGTGTLRRVVLDASKLP